MASSAFIKSEQGTKAAWKGFSSQTTYIAYRLMLLDDNDDFLPETAEDLMIKKSGVVNELVQVKNLSADLALSHLSPQENDSFFRRCLSYKCQNENLVLKVVSFGNIGTELSGLIAQREGDYKAVSAKMTEYGYNSDEITWVLSHLVFEKVDESELTEQIFSVLQERIETMAAPQISLNVLINYVSTLSRNNGHTSKEIWDKKLHDMAMDFAAVEGIAKQYGNTLMPIYEYKDIYDLEKLKAEYALGINALPQHIRANLDIKRKYWLNKLEYVFESERIVIVRGASGQGKSTLAFRYLLDNYPERDVFCVENISTKDQAVDIRSALNGLSKNRESSLMVYIDVSPYDITWLWLCEQIYKHGPNISILVTIREEDFRRTPIDLSKFEFAEIELSLSKEQGRIILKLIFLSFFQKSIVHNKGRC